MDSEIVKITPVSLDLAKSLQTQSFEQAKSLRDDLIWQQLDKTSVEEAVRQWMETLSHKTRLNYHSGMRKLAELGLLDPSLSLQFFSLINHDAIIDRIKLVPEWSECSRQARAACYISFTRFLNRRTQGIINKALPSKEGSGKTFFRVYDKVKTEAMTQAQWMRFFEFLEQNHPRECLIAKVILQGGKRVSEVLSLQVHQIDFEKRKITFTQSKTKGLVKQTVITYPESVMEKLRIHIGGRTDYVFVSRFGKPIDLRWVAAIFAKAGAVTRLPFKITPHVLRASTVTYLKQQGFPDSDIMKITGHASSEMVHAYDKSSREDNASAKVWLVS